MFAALLAFWLTITANFLRAVERRYRTAIDARVVFPLPLGNWIWTGRLSKRAASSSPMALYVISDGLDSKTNPSMYVSMKALSDFDALALRFPSTASKASDICMSMAAARSSKRRLFSAFVWFLPLSIRFRDIS